MMGKNVQKRNKKKSYRRLHSIFLYDRRVQFILL